MGTRVKMVEVEIECDDAHCDDTPASNCPHMNNWHRRSDRNFLVIQDAFNEVGPVNDRFTDWTRCQEEPWATMARLMLMADPL